MHSYTMDLGGRPLTFEIGKIAKQANGSVVWFGMVILAWLLPLPVPRPLVKAWTFSR
jgi:hypothetical protein